MPTVPDVVGLLFAVARQRAWDAGVTLANPDPDGPPIGVRSKWISVVF
jgi:hypothetical protein